MTEESSSHLIPEVFRNIVVDKGIHTAVESADGQAHHVADVQVAIQLGVIAGVMNKEQNVAGCVEGHDCEQHKSCELHRVGVPLPAVQEGSQYWAVAEQHHHERSEESTGDQADEVVEVIAIILVPGENVMADSGVYSIQGIWLLLQSQGQDEDGSTEPDGSAGAGSEGRSAERTWKERMHHSQVPVNTDACEQQYWAVHVPIEESCGEPAQAFPKGPVIAQEIVENLEGQHQHEQQVCCSQVHQKDSWGQLLSPGGQDPQGQPVWRQPHQEDKGVEAGNEPHCDHAAQLRACGLVYQQVRDVVYGCLFPRDGSGTRCDLWCRRLLIGAVLRVICQINAVRYLLLVRLPLYFAEQAAYIMFTLKATVLHFTLGFLKVGVLCKMLLCDEQKKLANGIRCAGITISNLTENLHNSSVVWFPTAHEWLLYCTTISRPGEPGSDSSAQLSKESEDLGPLQIKVMAVGV